VQKLPFEPFDLSDDRFHLSPLIVDDRELFVGTFDFESAEVQKEDWVGLYCQLIEACEVAEFHLS
jgi:hypothetical protein